MANKPTQPNSTRKGRRRRRGVPKALAILMIVLALAVGGGLGYGFGNHNAVRSSEANVLAVQEELDRANARITDLETVLELMDVDPQDDFMNYVSGVSDEAINALAGEDQPAVNNDVLVDDSGLLSGDGAENVADPSQSEPVVVAEFDGGTLMSDEVLAAYDQAMSQLMLATADASQMADSVMQSVMESLVSEKIYYAKAEELGLTTYTEEDEAAIAAEAEAQFEDNIAMMLDFVTQEGDTPEQAREAAIQSLEENDGVTLDSLKEEIRENYWLTKLKDYVTQDVTVSQEEIDAAYDQLLEEQQALFTANADEYEFARDSGQLVVYNLEGYRTFKPIFLALDADASYRCQEIYSQIESLDPEADAEEIEQLNQELDTLFASLESTAEEIQDRINDGADFDSLIAEYGDDTRLLEEPYKTTGYYVCESTTLYAPEIVSAVMALDTIGSVSEPVRCSDGLYILRYTSDVTPGPVNIQLVQADLEAETLESRKFDVYDAQAREWVEEANVVYHPEVLQ